jgi:hypothetical protein
LHTTPIAYSDPQSVREGFAWVLVVFGRAVTEAFVFYHMHNHIRHCLEEHKKQQDEPAFVSIDR